MRELLRRISCTVQAWLPVRDSGRVERAWAAMGDALDTVDFTMAPAHRSQALLTLFGQPAGDGGQTPTRARLELLAEHWERALVVNSVFSRSPDLRNKLVGYGRDLALQVLASGAAQLSASDIGAQHANTYRATSQSFHQIVELVAAFLHDVGENSVAKGNGRWSRVLAEFVSGYAAATQVRALEEQEEVFMAIAEVYRKNHEGYLATSTSRFLESPIAMATVTREGQIVETNAALQELLGFSADALAGRSLIEFVRSGQDKRILEGVYQALPSVRTSGHSRDFRLDRGSREVSVWVKLHWKPSESRPGHVHIGLYDTTYYHLQHDWHLSRTRYDEVTSLPTKAHLLARLTELLDERAEPVVVGLYGIRLSGLASISETLGLGAADEVLTALAARVARATAYAADLVAHLDRDTIAILVVDPTSWADAGEMVRRLVDWASHPVRTRDDEHEVSVRPIVGAVQGRPGDASPRSMVRQLEISMRPSSYRSIDVAHNERDTQRNRELARLSAALEQRELTLAHQPIARVKRDELAGSHAFPQWANPDQWHSTVNELVELADSVGLSLPIGQWLIREAAVQARRWQLMYGAKAPFVRVDVPDRLAGDEFLLNHVHAVLAETKVSPDLLVLGVTEAGILGDDGEPRPHLFGLSALRIPLVLIGLGVSVQRFDLLRTTVLDGVTIASELAAVEGEVPSQGSKSVLPGLIGMARGLDLSVGISDIDTPAQWELAKRVGATYVAGEMVGPAGSTAAIEALLPGGRDTSRAGPS